MAGRPFEMPMIKDFVPKAVRPFMYLLFVVCFQLVNGVYMGESQQIMGDLSLMREDVMMVNYFGTVGVAMPFPLLFRLKFAFTNRRLLLFAVGGMAVIQLVVPHVTWLPLWCLLSYVCCFMKLMATFEIFSNIQLWMTPKRDFRIFFPLIYIVILGDKTLSSWFAEWVVYHTDSWQAIHYVVAAILMAIWLVIYLCTRPFRFMRPIPFISIDFLGCLLWSATLLQGVWLFTYGEYYNWWDSALWRMVLVAWPVTLFITLQRARHIRHPYISLDAFKYRRLWPILFMFFVGEWMNSTPKVLQTAFTGSVMHWGMTQTEVFNPVSLFGTLSGCLFCLYWIKILRRQYVHLMTVGLAFLLAYQVMMYFFITPSLDLQHFLAPIFLRDFGYAIFFVTLTVYLQELMPFHHFFMGLTIAGFIRNGLVGAVCSGLYSYGMRYHIADNLASGYPFDMAQITMMSVKQLYGITCLIGTIGLLLALAWNVKPLRSSFKKIPYWYVVGQQVRKQLNNESKAARRKRMPVIRLCRFPVRGE